MYSYKIINQSELPTWRKKITLQGKKVCATNGCFDLLHAGHIKYLYESSKYADVLIIGCNGDESVRSLKGKKRPIQKEKDRAYFSGGFRHHLKLLVLMDMSAFRLFIQFRTCRS